MIIRFVKFKSALSNSEVMRLFKQRAPEYHKLPGLLQKHYIRDKHTGEYGAVYLWDSMKSMQEFQQSELSRSIPLVYKIENQPRVEILDVAFTLRPDKQ
jgi:heme-degrading monooxygenase HmoA